MLRERRSIDLDTMMRNIIEVDLNLMTSRKIKQIFNKGDNKPYGDMHPSTSRSLDEKFDLMMKMMEKMMEIMSMGNRPIS
jgi:hypothetical protein